ncbi:MAG: hypothetical protein ACJA0N_000592 [Pseudohongiellaceae bacterium]|jgi:hypothetical protein
MSYLIIIVIVAVVLGPVMWLMPTARQKQQVALRQYAMELGLQIKICDMPQSYRERVRKESIEQGVVYRLPLIRNRPLSKSKVYCLHKADEIFEWQSDALAGKQQVFERALSLCPSSATAIEFSAAGVACYWQEKGGMPAVDDIKKSLEQLRSELKDVMQA